MVQFADSYIIIECTETKAVDVEKNGFCIAVIRLVENPFFWRNEKPEILSVF